MTFFSHGTMAGMATFALIGNVPISVASGVLGALPDVGKLSIVDKYFPGWYRFFHRPWLNKGLKRILGWASWLVPPIGLHGIVDVTCHNWTTWKAKWWGVFIYEPIFWGYMGWLVGRYFGVIGAWAVLGIALLIWLDSEGVTWE